MIPRGCRSSSSSSSPANDTAGLRALLAARGRAAPSGCAPCVWGVRAHGARAKPSAAALPLPFA
eukprot:7021901-Pyramimonas_sp.AAC.1